MSHQHATATCRSRMSYQHVTFAYQSHMPHQHATAECYSHISMSQLNATATSACHSWMLQPYGTAACHCYISQLHATAICTATQATCMQLQIFMRGIKCKKPVNTDHQAQYIRLVCFLGEHKMMILLLDTVLPISSICIPLEQWCFGCIIQQNIDTIIHWFRSGIILLFSLLWLNIRNTFIYNIAILRDQLYSSASM